MTDEQGQPQEPLAQVREILLGQDRERLDRLEARSLSAEELSRLLPDAIRLRTASDDEELDDALALTLEGTIDKSVRRDPQGLADVLFPVLGPAIRKAIQAALAGMIESFNRTLENSLSPASMRWRFEAWRTKRSFAEVVLLHTLVYRVEQVFLIEGSSGVLLEHVQAPAVIVQDPDLVSAMLRAIQDFVSDSFEGGPDPIQRIGFRDLNIVVAAGPKALLAAVVRGNPPADFEVRLQETIEHLHAALGGEFERFDGDTSVFHAAVPALESCLTEQRQAQKKSKAIWLVWIVLALVVAGLVALWALALVRDAREEDAAQQRWSEAVATLRDEPGLMILLAERDDEQARLVGLRDAGAADPDDLLRDAGYDPADIDARWESYVSLEPPFVLARAQRVLSPPESVTLELRDDVLHATGHATFAWIQRAEYTAPSVDGVSRLDTSAVSDLSLKTVAELAGQLEELAITFPPGSAEPILTEGDRLAFVHLLTRLDSAARQTRRFVRIEARGRAEPAESGYGKLQLRHRRAVAARLELEMMHMGGNLLFGVGPDLESDEEDGDADHRRRAELTAHVLEPDDSP